MRAALIGLFVLFTTLASATEPLSLVCSEDVFGEEGPASAGDEFEERLKEANIYLTLYSDISEAPEIAQGLGSVGVTSDHLLALELRLPGKYRDRSIDKKQAVKNKQGLTKRERFFAHNLDREVYSQMPFDLRAALREELDHLPQTKTVEREPLPLLPELVPAEDLDPLFESFTFPEVPAEEVPAELTLKALNPKKVLRALVQTYGRKELEAFDSVRPKLKLGPDAKSSYAFTPDIKQLMNRIVQAHSGDQVRDAVNIFEIIGVDLFSTVNYAELEPQKQAILSESVWNFFLNRIPNSRPRFVDDPQLTHKAWEAFNAGWAARDPNISSPSQRLTREGEVHYLFRHENHEYVFSICAVERQCGRVGLVRAIYPRCGPGVWAFDPNVFGKASYYLTKSYWDWQAAVRAGIVRGKDSAPRKVVRSLTDLGFTQILCRDTY